MMLTVTLADPLASQLAYLAHIRATSAEALAETVVRAFLQQEAEHLIAQEAAAFKLMHADLLVRYPGQYVAVHQGQVIDHDNDQLALYERVEPQYPDVPILIRQVQPQVEVVYTVRSPRFVYG